MESAQKARLPTSWRVLLVCLSMGCGLDIVGAPSGGSDGGTGSSGAGDASSSGGIDGSTVSDGSVVVDDGGTEADGALKPPAPFLSVAVANVSTTTNLTTEGTVDWSHWGRSSLKGRNRKSGGVGIGDYAITSTPPYGGNASASPTDFNWSDGTPTTTESGTPTYDWYGSTSGATNAFTVTVDVDASTAKRTATFYLGVWYGKGHVDLSLTDSSASVFVDDTLDRSNGQTIMKYTADFAAGSPTAKLRLRFTLAKAYISEGAIRIAAITLR